MIKRLLLLIVILLSIPLTSEAIVGGTFRCSINSGSCGSNVDFDDTTPAAPTNGYLIKWLSDSSDPKNLSGYFLTTLVGTTTWGSGSDFTWTMNTSASSNDPQISFAGNSGRNISFLGVRQLIFEPNADNASKLELHGYEDDSSSFALFRAKGVYGSPTAVGSSSTLGSFKFLGYDGANYITGPVITARVEGTVSANIIPSIISLTTSDLTGLQTDWLTIHQDGVIDLLGFGHFGKNIDFEGATVDDFETLFSVTDPTVDRTVTIPNADSTTVQPDAGVSNNFLTAISSSGVISKAQPTISNIASFNYVASVATTSPLSGGAAGSSGAILTLTIANAIADGATKGAASFTATDFDTTTGNVSLDYTNGQEASGSLKGFLPSADWTTFNNKQATITWGAGLAFSGSTALTDSTETGFFASGALTCGASTQGKAQVHTTPLQYCDNTATPVLRYAAYGDSAGAALSGDTATAFFSAGTIEDTRLSTLVSLLGQTIDLTTEITGTLPIANGGTNGTTSQAGINNLSQLTTNGDLLYHNGTNSTRLARGADTQCLTSSASTILWGSCSAGGGDNISVNGTAAVDADFDDTTPAAPANTINIKWQKDALTPNNISAYVPQLTSVQLLALVTDETGTGAACFATSPTIASPTFTGTTKISERLDLSGDISPTQITADQTDYNPTDLATNSVLRLDASRFLTINSLDGGADGRILTLINKGSYPIRLLADNGATGTASMRLKLNGDVILGASDSIILIYDSTSSRWRPFSLGLLSSYIDPMSRFIVFDEMIGNTIGSQLAWNASTSGTGASCQKSTYGIDATNKVLGQINQCDTGTTTTGSAAMITGSSTMVPTLGQLIIVWRVAFDTLSTASEEYIARIGFHDAFSADAVDGLYFEYDRLTSTNWRIAASGTSTRTKETSGTDAGSSAVAVDTNFIWLMIVTNAAWTSADFFSRANASTTWTWQGNIADANIPTATETLDPRMQIIKSAGSTASNLDADRFYMIYNFAN